MGFLLEDVKISHISTFLAFFSRKIVFLSDQMVSGGHKLFLDSLENFLKNFEILVEKN